jgi:cobalt/nickel transport system ATP-binding protein
LLKLIAGLLSYQNGEVYLQGKKITPHTADLFRSVGILFQDPNDQLFCAHVHDDVAFGAKNLGLSDDAVKRLVQTALESMEITHLAQRPIYRLSFGEMKRVGLAGILAMRPPLILLDEPTAYLDPAASRQLIRLVKNLNSQYGYTFIIVTHNMELASTLGRRVILLKDGKIAADGAARDVLTDEALLRACRLAPPLLTQLFKKIEPNRRLDCEIPLTLDEAATVLQLRKSDRNI